MSMVRKISPRITEANITGMWVVVRCEEGGHICKISIKQGFEEKIEGSSLFSLAVRCNAISMSISGNFSCMLNHLGHVIADIFAENAFAIYHTNPFMTHIPLEVEIAFFTRGNLTNFLGGINESIKPMGAAANGASGSTVGAELECPPVLSLARAIRDGFKLSLLPCDLDSRVAKDRNELLDPFACSVLA